MKEEKQKNHSSGVADNTIVNDNQKPIIK